MFTTQDELTLALERANENVVRRRYLKYQKFIAPITIIYLVILAWALLLAMQTKGGSRTTNIALALIVPPIYIISHYLSVSDQGGGETS